MAEKIKLKYKMMGPGSQFLASLNEICNQSFGGKQDAALFRMLKVIMGAGEEYQALREKATRRFGKLDPKMGAYSLRDLDVEKLKEYDAYIQELAETEFELPITEPVKIVRRKSHKLPSINAALVSDVIEVVWPADDGEHLDEEKEAK